VQAQLQALAERRVGGKVTMVVASTKVTRPQIFNETLSKVSGFSI